MKKEVPLNDMQKEIKLHVKKEVQDFKTLILNKFVEFSTKLHLDIDKIFEEYKEAYDYYNSTDDDD